MPGDVAAILASVAAALPGGGEDRPGQQAMAAAVAKAIDGERHLVVQAGTGTGKSLAYAVPAALSGHKVVVATATKALQDQLATKDLPAVAAALDQSLAFAVLKGRSNYLCLQRAGEVAGDGHQQALDEQAAGETGRLVDQLRRLLRWGAETDTGDRGDLDFEPDNRAWAMVSVGPRECPGAARCPSGDRCFAERARRRAAEADVVVVNTHLYGAHLASGGTVLPPHEVVVLDEAHETEEVMTASLGVDLSPGRLAALHTAARPLLGGDRRGDDGGPDGSGEGAPVVLDDVAERLRAALAGRVGERVLRRAPASSSARPAAGAVDPEGAARDLGGRAEPEGRARGRATPAGSPNADPRDAELADLLALAAGRVDRLRAALGTAGDDARATRALTAAGSLADDLARLAAPGPDDVAWVDGTTRAPVLRLSPVDVGPLLAEHLWGEVTAVLTSATMPPRLSARLGLEAFAHDELDVGSPFDYRSHSLLYVARHLPDRRRPDVEPALHDELEALVRAAGGRTLALFTSRRAAESAGAALRGRLPYRLLVQGDLPKGRLLETFSDEETSCLFATLGFWQGVDVPGRSCSLVTLDRLPFGRPDDPLLAARRERAGDAAFQLVDLPRAATLLAQGVGRLIRSADDHGVVAVLDPRLATAGYRRVLLDALPPMRRTVDRQEVARFLSEVLGTA